MITSGFHRKVDETWAHLGYYAAYSDETLKYYVITYRSHSQGSRNPIKSIILSIGGPERSVTNYHYILHNSPEDSRFLIMRSFI